MGKTDEYGEKQEITLGQQRAYSLNYKSPSYSTLWKLNNAKYSLKTYNVTIHCQPSFIALHFCSLPVRCF